MALELACQTLPPRVSVFTPEESEGHPQAFCGEQLPGGRTAFGIGSEVQIHHGEGFSRVNFGWGISITAMCADEKGRLFVGGDSRIGVIVPNRSGERVFRSLLPLLPDSLHDFGSVWNICTVPYEKKGGGVYFNAFGQIFYFDGDTIERSLPRDKFYMMHQPGGMPVVQDDDEGLFQVVGGQKKKLPGSEAITPHDDIGVTEILPFHGSGEEWLVLTERSGLQRYHPEKGELSPFPEDDIERRRTWKVFKEERVFLAASLDPNKNPYGAAYAVGTMQGGVRLLGPGGRIVARIGKEDGLPSPMIWELIPDPHGNLWATTNAGIALIHTGSPFTYSEKGTEYEGGINDIERVPGEGEENDVLALATSQGVWTWEERIRSFEQLSGTEEQCMGAIPFGEGLAIAGEKYLLYSKDGRKAQRIPDPALDPSAPEDLIELPFPGKGRGRVLSSGQLGLYVHQATNKGRWEREIEVSDQAPAEMPWVGFGRSGLPPDSIRLWGGMRTQGGLAVLTDTAFSGRKLVRYDSTDGLPKGPVVVFQNPWQEASCLFGTRKGLYRFENGHFEKACGHGEAFCREEKLPLLRKGQNGKVWTLRGEKQVVLMHPEGKAYRPVSLPFEVLDIGEVRDIHPEGEAIWIGGDQGLACYHPDVEKDYRPDWSCHIREVRGSRDSLLFGGVYPEAEGKGFIGRVPTTEQPKKMMPVLPYRMNRLEFRFAAPFPDRQEAVAYSYKLVGFDTSWSKWEEEAKKEYTNLDEGHYSFKVKARNIFGHSSQVATYRFRILPPWYRTTGAYAGYGVVSVLFIWGIAWANGRRLAAQKRRLEQIVQQRTREIQAQKEKTEKAHEELSEAHREITDSIDYAQKIQSALLQSKGELSGNDPEHFVLFRPQARVSGDFYWVREHHGHLYLAAVDCTGHGVPGAFMSMLGISLLNEIMANHGPLDPGEVLTLLRDRVVRELSGEGGGDSARDGMDAALVKVPVLPDPSSKEDEVEVRFAGAQNPLYVVRKGIGEGRWNDKFSGRIKPFKRNYDGIEVRAERKAVGYSEFDQSPFTTVSLQLQQGDMLYLFSDGFADQFGGPQGKKFRYGPFKDLLVRVHQKGLQEQKEELERSFDQWKDESEQEQVDDVLVMGVRL